MRSALGCVAWPCTKLDEETVIQPHHDFGKHRAWRIVFALAHLWFMLANAHELVSAAMRRRHVGWLRDRLVGPPQSPATGWSSIGFTVGREAR